MKDKKTISILIVIVAIIIAGIITVALVDFNYNFDYSKTTSIYANLGKEYILEDINSILNETFNNQKKKVEEDKKSFTLVLKGDISEEQKTALIGKLNEKYELELKVEDLIINITPRMKMKDILAPYVVPFIISSVLIVIYFVIIYRKARIEEVIIISFFGIIAVQLLSFSIIAITRIPVGNYIMSISMYIYVITVLIINKVLENLKKK